jgi:hypothetical protein
MFWSGHDHFSNHERFAVVAMFEIVVELCIVYGWSICKFL